MSEISRQKFQSNKRGKNKNAKRPFNQEKILEILYVGHIVLTPYAVVHVAGLLCNRFVVNLYEPCCVPGKGKITRVSILLRTTGVAAEALERSDSGGKIL